MLSRSPLPRDQRGMALAMAIVLTGICTVIILGLMQYIYSEYKAAHVDWAKVQVFYCAEAGVEHAVEHIRVNNIVNDEDIPGGLDGVYESGEVALEDAGVPGVEGSFEYTLKWLKSGGVKDPAGGIRVEATGYLPSKADVQDGKGVSRRVVAVMSPGVWDFGLDAVRSRSDTLYGSNNDLTVVVVPNPGYPDPDSNNDERYLMWDGTAEKWYRPWLNANNPLYYVTEYTLPDGDVNASIRVTGTSSTAGSVTGSDEETGVAGDVTAVLQVTILPDGTHTVTVGEENYIANAFPDATTLGYDDGDPAALIWPPAAGSWAANYYKEALADNVTVSNPTSGTFTAPCYIDMGGTGTLEGVTLKGPGTIFVHGNVGPLTNGSPPAQVVATGTLSTRGNEVYQALTPDSTTLAPPLILFGRDTNQGWSAQIQGHSIWDLKGPLMSLNPDAEVAIDDSAVGLFGAVMSNGTVNYKSAQAALGYPLALAGQRYTVKSLPIVRSYSAQ